MRAMGMLPMPSNATCTTIVPLLKLQSMCPLCLSKGICPRGPANDNLLKGICSREMVLQRRPVLPSSWLRYSVTGKTASQYTTKQCKQTNAYPHCIPHCIRQVTNAYPHCNLYFHTPSTQVVLQQLAGACQHIAPLQSSQQQHCSTSCLIYCSLPLSSPS